MTPRIVEFTVHANQQSEYVTCSNGHSVILIVRKTTRKTFQLAWCPHCKAEMRLYTKRIERLLSG